MKKVYLGNRQLTTLATREEGGGGGNDELAKSLIDRSITSVDIPNGVTKIGNGAFAYYSGLTSVTIPDTVTSIGDYAFSNSNELTTISIPWSVKTIGIYAFQSCSGLTSVDIYDFWDGIRTISKGMFSYCTSLSSVTIPSVSSIDDNAFEGCSSLTSVTIPSSVQTIGDSAFDWCSSLADVTIYSTNMIYYKWGMFANIASNAVLHVPSDLVSEYQADSNWTDAFQGGIVAI